MLSLRSTTPVSWVRRVEAHLPELLVDHAHCEKKAAGTAMNMVFAYVEHVAMARALSEIVDEELAHFRAVLDLLGRRGIPMVGQPQSRYGARLRALCRTEEPAKLLDRLLVAALIEARSCERFTLLSRELEDPELAAFYGALLESEARHFGTYLRLAHEVAGTATVDARLAELASEEAVIIARGDPLARLHS